MSWTSRLLPGLAVAPILCAAQVADLPADAVILAGVAADGLLEQCSRGAPQDYDGHWRPTAEDIAALEAALAPALGAERWARSVDWARAPQGWWRQYGGFLRQGRRYIYGSFSRGGGPGIPDWRERAIIVCDGGPANFGVEYDVEARRFTHIQFNGR